MLDVDIAVVGGGLVGSSLATALVSHPLAKGLTVALVDPQPSSLDQWPPLSLRTSTITPSSKGFLEQIGVWDYVPLTRVAPFGRMFVWDHPAPLPMEAGESGAVVVGGLMFEAKEVGEEVLGYVVDNDVLRGAMYRSMADLMAAGGALNLVRGKLQSIDFVEGEVEKGGDDIVPWPQLIMEDGQRVRARLIAACDGARSRVRTLAGADWFMKGYGQSAVVANVQLRDTIDTAFQRFVSTGPVAVLPVCTEESAVPMANVIWTTTRIEAEALKAADDAVFLNELNIVLRAHEDSGKENIGVDVVNTGEGKAERQGILEWMVKGVQRMLPSLGGEMDLRGRWVEPPDCTSVVGERGMFPLSVGHAPRYVIEERRTVLVGDAAHCVHPLAGQGVNMGFADVELLTESVVGAAATGRDIGGEGGAPLMKYQTERMMKNVGMMGVLHSLQQVFGWNSMRGAREMRRVGMSAINAARPVKKLILRAMR